MSPEVWLWGAVTAGHLTVCVWLLNVTHALGLEERRTKGIKLLFLTLVALVPLWFGEEAWSGPWLAWSLPARLYGALCLGATLVALPAITVMRALRRTPAGIVERSEEIDLFEGGQREDFIGPGKHAWMLRLPRNESLRLRKREWQVTLPGLPASWDGLRLLHLTDLHFAPCFDRRYFEAVADAVRGWEADFVLFTGDLVDHDRVIDWVVPVLSRVRGRLGNYAILGNHDLTHQPDRIVEELERAGFTNVDGRWERLAIHGRTLALGGTSYPWGPALAPDAMPEADFRLLLSHTPDELYRASRWGIDLMLSGHNHGGQVRLPVIGPVFMPSLYSRRFDRGFFRAGRTLLHVSQGVSGMHPLRYGCVPEVGRLILRAVPQPHFTVGAAGQKASIRGGV